MADVDALLETGPLNFWYVVAASAIVYGWDFVRNEPVIASKSAGYVR